MKLFLIAGALSLSLGTTATAATIYNDLIYSDADERNLLDITIPDGVTNAPLVLFIHGGAWFRGSKDFADRTLFGRDRLLDAGFAFAAMNYRLLPETWPAQEMDVGAAIEYLKMNAGTYGYNADRFALFGESAGAHLALAAGLTYADNPDRNVDAVVSWYGITDLKNIDADREAAGFGRNNRGDASPESRLIGGNVEVDTEAADAASPLSMLSNVPDATALPSFLLMHGDLDNVIPFSQSERLYDALIEDGRNAEFFLIKGGTHAGGAFADEQRIDTVIDYLYGELDMEVAPVPLPASLPLLLLGLGAFVGLKRRHA